MKNGLVVNLYGSKCWYKDGLLHREEGPAEEHPNGNKAWYFHGKFHRIDGPAIETAGGYKVWYLYGKLHREDGPTIEYTNGTKIWFYQGINLTATYNCRDQETFEKLLKILAFL